MLHGYICNYVIQNMQMKMNTEMLLKLTSETGNP